MNRISLPFLVSGVLFLTACSNSSTEDTHEEGRTASDDPIVGTFEVVKMGGSVLGMPMEYEDVGETWVFEEDSLIMLHTAYVERIEKKEGKNFKNTWYDIDERVFTNGDTTILEITSYDPQKMTREYILLPKELSDAENQFIETKVKWEFALGKLWQFQGALDADRAPLRGSDVGFAPLDQLDLREENAANFWTKVDSLFYTDEGIEHVFTLTFLYDYGDMRLVPISQCACEDKFVGYLAD